MSFPRLIVPLAAVLLSTGSAHAAPALWKVSDEDSAIYLFGSVHLLPPGLEWRTPRFDKVVSKVERVYFETDISVEAQVAIAPLSYELGFNRDGRLLSERIGPELTDQLRDVAHAYNIPMPLLLTMQPWMAATTLSLGGLTHGGYDPLLGVDQILGAEIPSDRHGYLETPEQQIGFLAGGTEDEQIEMLRATIVSMDIMTSEIDDMVEVWMDGNPEAVGEIFMSQMGDMGEGMAQRLIDQRNHDWTDQIAAMLQRNESTLLIVGAGHLVDDISVVRLLEARGFTSERVQ
jgi:uncharacterized protein YbaP (TraB family)